MILLPSTERCSFQEKNLPVLIFGKTTIKSMFVNPLESLEGKKAFRKRVENRECDA